MRRNLAVALLSPLFRRRVYTLARATPFSRCFSTGKENPEKKPDQDQENKDEKEDENPFELMRKSIEREEKAELKGIIVGKDDWKEVYIPVKDLTFSSTNSCRVYLSPMREREMKDTLLELFINYFAFGAYLTMYGVYWDWSNKWHYLGLAGTFYYGSRRTFLNSRNRCFNVHALHILRDGSFTVILPRSAHFDNLEERIEEELLSQAYDEKKYVIVRFTKDNIRGTKFDETLEKESSSETKEKRPSVVELSRYMNRLLVMMIEKEGYFLPLMFNLGTNQERSYNDYIIALGLRRKIILSHLEE
eukprot:TRINITY_DN252_c0_g1_i1.p1 TRINITY_DN252_c0_g1~~TRINITY_DN252_c0_g1_i1.p1  ORF type:complete len:304 (-),score=76.96 TRINITY_DN252_c0_g1_i1:105-1016(-)